MLFCLDTDSELNFGGSSLLPTMLLLFKNLYNINKILQKQKLQLLVLKFTVQLITYIGINVVF